MTTEKQKEEQKKLAGRVYDKFKQSMLAKDPFTKRWLEYLNAWENVLFEKTSGVSYKSNHVSNFIYSTIESMRPIVFDNNPKFEAIPVTADGMDYANDMTAILDWEWHRTGMQGICLANSIYTFAIGTSCIMLTYNYDDKTIGGNVKPIAVSPMNLFPDPLATSVDDAEYIIYANYIHVNKLKNFYPQFANELEGSNVKFSELVNERDKNSTNNNQVLILEMWCRDYTIFDDKDENGDVLKKRKYPRGRVITVAPELDIILEDKENPYQSGRFPFFIFKDIDVPFQFWGEGEVRWLLSPQKSANDLYNQIIDNARHTANMQWIVDKNAGIPKGELTNRPGLIIRKNPNSEVRRDSPPSMPMYVSQMIDTLKMDIEVVSGVHDVTRGQTPTGIQSAAAIVALQEAAQTRIRLKIQLFENTLGELGTEWVERIKQFWKFNRLIPRKTSETEQLPHMELVGNEIQSVTQKDSSAYDMINVSPNIQLSHDYNIKVIGASAMKSSKMSMLDQLIRLMQTTAEDGLPCVPREIVLDYLPDVDKKLVMHYFQKLKEERMQQEQQQGVNNQAMQALQQLQQQVQQIGDVVGQLVQKSQEEEQNATNEKLKEQGYQSGVADATLSHQQLDKSGELPPELLEELSEMTEEELGQIMSEHPEIANLL